MSTRLAFAFAFLAAAAIAGPALAANSMMSASHGAMMMSASHGTMMKSGESMMIMPNGETMMAPAMKPSAAMMKAATPVDDCMIFMMGTDHKMYMMHDMKMANGKMVCESMSAMKH